MASQTNRCKQPGYLRPTEDPSKMSLSFAGCGFLCIYHAGVSAAIKEYAPQLMKNKMYGASAGSIVAAGLICNVCMSEAIMIMLATVSKANSLALQTLSPNFDLMGIVREGLQRMLPSNAHELCSGRLFISLTRFRDFKNVVISEFETRDELIQAILASSHIPFYCGWNPPHYRGEAYCDGGLSDNQPVYDRNTITVSPFSGESDICPTDEDSASLLGVDFYNTSIRITTQNLFRLFTTLFPPSLDICAKICRQGFQDALVLLNKKGLAPCVRCLTMQSNPLVLPPQDIERVRNQSIMSNRARRKLESECEVCYDNVDTSFPPTTDSLFPPILQKAIDDAKFAENRLFRYLNSFRVFRWGRRCMAPFFLPLDFTMLTFRTIHNWFTSPQTTDFCVKRFYATLDFILAEIAKNNLLYSSQISRQLAPLFEAERNTGLAYRLNRPSDVHFLPTEVIGDNQVTFEDSLQRLIEFDTKRDEILAYFYMNFNMEFQPHIAPPIQNHRKSRSFSSSLKRPSISRPAKMYQTIGTVEERDSVLDELADSNRAEDSGYTEEDTANSTKRRKDACCSPVQNSLLRNATNTSNCCCKSVHQIPSKLIETSKNDEFTSNPGCIRRHTFAGKREFGSNSSKSTLSGPAAYDRPMSSDSEDNADKLFVPNRQRSNSSSAYDGEPEQSD